MARQTIGDRIRVAREHRDMDRSEVAIAVGVSTAKVGRWECGVTIPRVDEAELLARAVGVEPIWLAFGVRQRRAV